MSGNLCVRAETLRAGRPAFDVLVTLSQDVIKRVTELFEGCDEIVFQFRRFVSAGGWTEEGDYGEEVNACYRVPLAESSGVKGAQKSVGEMQNVGASSSRSEARITPAAAITTVMGRTDATVMAAAAAVRVADGGGSGSNASSPSCLQMGGR